MKKLMILGASGSQLPLIRAAKRLGAETVVCSTPGNWPGFAEADSSAFVDISDPEAVLAEARRQRIDGIATCCLDTGVPAIGKVCEAMRLRGPGETAAGRAADKYAMKTAFRAAGVQTADFFCIRNLQELEAALKKLSFPVVLKAVDQMGSRGIFRCDTREEALTCYKKAMEATRRDYCLAEEFLDGTLFGAEAMIRDGKFLYCMPDNTESIVNANGVSTPVGHSVPFEGGSEIFQQAVAQVEKAVRALGLDNCPVNCDLMLCGDRVYVVEVTGRAGATGLPEIVGVTLGIDYYEAIVRLALNMEVERLFLREPEVTDSRKSRVEAACPAVLSHTIRSDRDGVVKNIQKGNVSSSDILELSLDVRAGEAVRRYQNGRDRLGQILLTGGSLAECRCRLEQVLSQIVIAFE